MIFKVIDLSDKDNPIVTEGDELRNVVRSLNANCFLIVQDEVGNPASIYAYNITSSVWGSAVEHELYPVLKTLRLINAI